MKNLILICLSVILFTFCFQSGASTFQSSKVSDFLHALNTNNKEETLKNYDSSVIDPYLGWNPFFIQSIIGDKTWFEATDEILNVIPIDKLGNTPLSYAKTFQNEDLLGYYLNTYYDHALQKIENMRKNYKRLYNTSRAKEQLRKEAWAMLVKELMAIVFPTWVGTPWEFYGTSESPHQKTIACGYFVSTVLRDLGFKVERVRLAQQASANIVKSLVGDSNYHWYSGLSQSELEQKIISLGEGVYVVGLDYHVGFLVNVDNHVYAVHSTVMDTKAVIIEDASTSSGYYSKVHVVGELSKDAPLFEKWLKQTKISTRTK